MASAKSCRHRTPAFLRAVNSGKPFGAIRSDSDGRNRAADRSAMRAWRSILRAPIRTSWRSARRPRWRASRWPTPPSKITGWRCAATSISRSMARSRSRKRAIAEFNSLPAFRGPKPVTPQNLFRGFTAGDVVGPYVSQFLLMPFSYGAVPVTQLLTTYVPGVDYMTDQASWLAVQNGQGPFGVESGRSESAAHAQRARARRVCARRYFVRGVFQRMPGAGRSRRAARSEQSLRRLAKSDGIRHVWLAAPEDAGRRSLAARVESGVVSEMVRAPASAAGGIRRTRAHDEDEAGELSAAFRRSEFRSGRARFRET